MFSIIRLVSKRFEYKTLDVSGFANESYKLGIDVLLMK